MAVEPILQTSVEDCAEQDPRALSCPAFWAPSLPAPPKGPTAGGQAEGHSHPITPGPGSHSGGSTLRDQTAARGSPCPRTPCWREAFQNLRPEQAWEPCKGGFLETKGLLLGCHPTERTSWKVAPSPCPSLPFGQ